MTADDVEAKDLVILAADSQAKATLKTLLSERRRSLQIREISGDIYDHPNKDPGCLNKAHDFLRGFAETYRHALVIFDLHGCGAEDEDKTDLERQVQERLVQNGWDERRVRCLILDPELEIWVWSDSPETAQALGWEQHALEPWLDEQDLWSSHEQSKPDDPKKAMEAALEQAKIPRSASIYRRIASNVGLGRCTDSSFQRLKEVLQSWFGQ